MGRIIEEANPEEFYRAFSFALREEIMINWAATARSFLRKKSRMLYYLSMEYLPGRLMGNNITSLQSQELVRVVLKKLGRDFEGVYSCESDPGLGNGGLGRLASCFLDSMATQQYPAQGYGLRYQYGTFEQEIWGGVQVEKPDRWLLNSNPWEFRRDQRSIIVRFCGRALPTVNNHGESVQDLQDYEEVRALAYDIPIVGYNEAHDFSVNTLRLWSTKESPRNFEMQRFNSGQLGPASENTTLTDVLYPNDNHDVGKRIRLKQEFLLVSASLQDIIRHHLAAYGTLDSFADKVRIQINDTHPALVVAELMRLFTKEHEMTWRNSLDITQECLNYTNHTILKEALEMWNQNRMRHLLPRQYGVIEKLNLEFCNKVRERFQGDEERVRNMSMIQDGQVRMANLCVYGSHRVNGVAALHTEILKKTIFKDFYEMYPEKFVNVTNGVTQRRWLLHCNPSLASFITQRIGKEWITDFSSIRNLDNFARDEQSQQELLKVKRENKIHLIEFLRKTNSIRDFHGHYKCPLTDVDMDSLFDVQVKRIHEYKRQLLNALHLIMVYYDILDNPESRRVKRTAIIGGKAAAGYKTAKDIIRLFHCIARRINNDSAIQGKLKIIFVENYNVSKAERIIPAADLSEQISTAGMEASGTGNMKLSINGALTIGTDDGANIEMRQEIKDEWWPFLFGCSSEEISHMERTQSYVSWTSYGENLKISRAVEALRDHSFTEFDSEHESLSALYYGLMEGSYGEFPDRYFVLKDLSSYYDMQKKVEEFYEDKSKWAEYVIHNISGMGSFSSDVSIFNYAKKVWDLERCPPIPEVLEQVRREYSEHDRCRVLSS